MNQKPAISQPRGVSRTAWATFTARGRLVWVCDSKAEAARSAGPACPVIGRITITVDPSTFARPT